jgi:phage head maturation protease
MIHVRHTTSTLALRDGGDGRTLHGPLLPWNVPARVLDPPIGGRLVTEMFERGALADADPARVPLTATHPRDAGTLPIGRTLSIEERADAAWGEWLVSDTMIGNEVLALARDGVPLGLSIGFEEVRGGSRWSADRQRVTRTRATLDHIAVVRVPAYAGPASPGCGRQPPRPSAWPPSSPCCAVARRSIFLGYVQGRCRACHNVFVGPGDRCPKCRDKLRLRRRRKPR